MPRRNGASSNVSCNPKGLQERKHPTLSLRMKLRFPVLEQVLQFANGLQCRQVATFFAGSGHDQVAIEDGRRTEH